jgi:hypothetical protein
MSRSFADLDFEASYDCEVDPEFPGTGTWSAPTFRFLMEGHSRGTPLILRVQPRDAGEWIGYFQTGGWNEVTSIVATPNARTICVVNEGAGYVVDVIHPDSYEPIPILPVRGLIPLAELNLLTLWSFIDATAISETGISWTSLASAWMTSRSIGIDSAGISCRGLRCLRR